MANLNMDIAVTTKSSLAPEEQSVLGRAFLSRFDLLVIFTNINLNLLNLQ